MGPWQRKTATAHTLRKIPKVFNLLSEVVRTRDPAIYKGATAQGWEEKKSGDGGVCSRGKMYWRLGVVLLGTVGIKVLL